MYMCVFVCTCTLIFPSDNILLPSLQEVTHLLQFHDAWCICKSGSEPYVGAHSSNLSACKAESADYHLRASLPIESKKTRLSYTISLVFKAHFFLSPPILSLKFKKRQDNFNWQVIFLIWLAFLPGVSHIVKSLSYPKDRTAHVLWLVPIFPFRCVFVLLTVSLTIFTLLSVCPFLFNCFRTSHVLFFLHTFSPKEPQVIHIESISNCKAPPSPQRLEACQ